MQYPTGDVVSVDVPKSVVETRVTEQAKGETVQDSSYGPEVILVGLAIIAVALAIWRFFRFRRIRREHEAEVSSD